MGSISGGSKAPSQQIIYVPTTASSTTSSADVADPNEGESLADRAENVLRRSRSRLGTILTGFKGVLGQSDLVSPRKTLLGE